MPVTVEQAVWVVVVLHVQEPPDFRVGALQIGSLLAHRWYVKIVASILVQGAID